MLANPNMNSWQRFNKNNLAKIKSNMKTTKVQKSGSQIFLLFKSFSLRCGTYGKEGIEKDQVGSRRKKSLGHNPSWS
jgi:hypothetical protein